MSGLCSISSFSWFIPPFWRLEYSMRFPHSFPPSLASASICDFCSRFAAISHISYRSHTPIRYSSLYPACLDRDTLLLPLSKNSIERPSLTLPVLVHPVSSSFQSANSLGSFSHSMYHLLSDLLALIDPTAPTTHYFLLRLVRTCTYNKYPSAHARTTIHSPYCCLPSPIVFVDRLCRL